LPRLFIILKVAIGEIVVVLSVRVEVRREYTVDVLCLSFRESI
jgi:hypothetical protein